MIEEFWNHNIMFKNSVQLISHNNKVLVANTNNGKSIFVSLECNSIIMEAIKENYTFSKLLDCIEEEESKSYMKQLLEKLYLIRAWDFQEDLIKSEYFQIDIEITNQCNLNCKHCCRSAGDFLFGTELDNEKMLSILKKVVGLNPSLLTISGGEPLVRPDFMQLIDFIRSEFHGKLGLMTNATLIDRDMANFIATNFDKVDISIDGGDEASCSLLRGEGTFHKCISGIVNLKNTGFDNISASMVITSENIYAKDKFLNICKTYNLHPMLRKLDYVGRAKNIVQTSREKISNYNHLLAQKSFIDSKQWKRQPQIMTCQGAKLEFYIDHIGNIYPCGTMVESRFVLGNVLDISNLKEYLESRFFSQLPSYKLFESFKPCHIDKCKDCNYNLLCFSCVREVINGLQEGTIYDDCADKKDFFNMYWEDYETN